MIFRPLAVLILLLCLAATKSVAQRPVALNDAVDQYIFSFTEIELMEDPTGELTIDQVSSGGLDRQFSASATFSPQNYNRDSYYWYRVRIEHKPTERNWQLEFFDQTIDRVDFYQPLADGAFQHQAMGDQLPFNERFVKHKNFVVHVPVLEAGTYTYYFRLKSRQQADVLLVLRSVNYFFTYALDEYFFFGIFYGMILVFCFYNLLMFAAVRERHYLYYIMYLVGIGLYEMSADGIAYQYLWPNAAEWNQYAPGFSLYIASTFALFFAASLLNLRKQYPRLLWLLAGAFLFRTAFLVVSLVVSDQWFNFRFIEVVPFAAAFYAGIYSLRNGYRPARFMVVGYTFLFIGILIKLIQYLDFNWLPLGDLTHYSLGFSFIMEMMFLSFAISDKIRVMRVEREKAQQRIIEQLHENQRLKDNLNVELERQVNIKTHELQEKSAHIEQQNRQLAAANQQLALQADEIAAINALLAQDNRDLKHNVDVITEARLLSKEVDFEEFSALYHDDASCLKFLGDIKWQHGYRCVRCNHDKYGEGRSPHSRRCSKCGYDESVTAYTILQNTRLPINKAFYMIFLVFSTRGNISSHKLAEILKIRQSTCWSYSAKIKRAMKEKQKTGSDLHGGWDSILLTTHAEHP